MNLSVLNVTISQDAEGRFCLNDLHKAAGGLSKDQPSKWLILSSTIALIEELNVENLVAKQNQSVRKYLWANHKVQGTFVRKELVYAYAMWISPAFNLRVIRAFDAMAPKVSIPDSFSEALMLAAAQAKELEESRALLQEAAPKVEFVDHYVAADSGTQTVRQMCKIPGGRENVFSELPIRQ